MRKICIFTGTRAEYGLLSSVMKKLELRTDAKLQIIASGTHFSKSFGLTYQEIEKDGFHIDKKVPIDLDDDTPDSLCGAIGNAIQKLSKALQSLSPDLLVVLGDRYEALAVCTAAMIHRIPIAHISGGEATYGLIDEAIRHSITKMSHLHLTCTEEYRHRVIQLGENPTSVINTGALGVDIIKKFGVLAKKDLEKDIGFALGNNCLLVTFHPVTLDKNSAALQFQELLCALDKVHKTKLIFTEANADTDGRIINSMIKEYVYKNPHRAIAFKSMGQLRYLSAMKYSKAVVGNSSSGIHEAPAMRVPTINIGDRQAGRLQSPTIINCEPQRTAIVKSLNLALSNEFTRSLDYSKNPYEKEGTVEQIVEQLTQFPLEGCIKKIFYDLPHGI